MRTVRVVAVVQARMASSRLPGKVLADIAGQSMIEHVLQRAKLATTVDLVVLATSDRPSDDALESCAHRAGVAVYRGSAVDVLARFFHTATQAEASHVVRLTGDCPLLDPCVIDLIVRSYLASSVDYASNTIEPTYPDGLDAEVFSIGALQQAHEEARLRSDREHVTPYIWRQPARFSLLNVVDVVDRSALRWTVDTPADLAFVRCLADRAGRLPMGLVETLQLIESSPDLMRMKLDSGRNEGYRRSTQWDDLSGR